MSEMVERVARALHDARNNAADYDADYMAEARNGYRELARAAIAAMREPDKAMLHAAAKAMSPGRRPAPDYVPVADKHAIRYRAMIDEALKD